MKKVFTTVQNGNDVRGAAIATETEKLTLSGPLVAFIARAFADFLAQECGKNASELRVGVGHDSRVTAEQIKSACLSGLSVTQAYDCGLITTPAMFQSVLLPKSDFDGSVMITASHLPFNRNGMKFFTKDGALSKAELSGILDAAASLAEQYAQADPETILTCDKLPAGSIEAKAFDMRAVYCEHMKDVIPILRVLQVIVKGYFMTDTIRRRVRMEPVTVTVQPSNMSTEELYKVIMKGAMTQANDMFKK